MSKKKFFWLSLSLILVFVLSFHTTTREWSQDLGRHLKLGEIISKEHDLPRTNLFSYTFPDFPFANHHWLAEVVFYLLYQAGGDPALVTFKTFLFVAAFGVIFFLTVNRENAFLSFSALILPLLVFRERTDVRPEIFGFFFFSFYLLIFAKSLAGKKRWLYLLPACQAFWVNCHLSFVFGNLLLAAYLFYLWRGKKLLSWQSIPVVLALLANLVNPHGLRGALAPFMIWENYGYQIAENQSIFFLANFGGFRNIFFFKLCFALVLSTFIFLRRDGLLFAVWLALAGAAAWQIRHFPFFALFSFFVLGRNLPCLWAKVNPVLGKKLKPALIIFNLFIFVFFTIFYASNHYYLINDREASFGWGGEKKAAEGAEFFKARFASGTHFFNNFDIGSFFAGCLWPQWPVFTDSRPEAYPVEFWEEYRQAQANEEAWEKLVAKWQMEAVFVFHHDQTPWFQTFLNRLYHDPLWKLVYLDDAVVIFTSSPKTDAIVLEENKLAAENSSSYRLVSLANFFQVVGDEEKALWFFKKAYEVNASSYRANLGLANYYLSSPDPALNFAGQKFLRRLKSPLFWF